MLSYITIVKIILSSEREMIPVAMTTINPQEIKALKTLVWHLSREPMKENNFFEKINNRLCMTYKSRQTRQRTNNLRDELIWGMNSASELATVYYDTCRSISGGSQSTLPGDKAWCIIALIKRYSG